MILPDVNLLVYAVDETSGFHGAANAWLDEVLSSANPVGLCYATMLGFVRSVTSRRAFSNPLGLAEALRYVDGYVLSFPIGAAVRIPPPVSCQALQ